MPGKRPDGRLQACLAKSAIALRPATPAGAGFCCQLHKAAMGEYITAIWGRDEQVQRAFHEGAFIRLAMISVVCDAHDRRCESTHRRYTSDP